MAEKKGKKRYSSWRQANYQPPSIEELKAAATGIGFTELDSNFKEYVDNNGRFRFSYPKNWFVQESIWGDDIRAVVTNSPEGYFWMVVSYPLQTDPDATARQVLETMRGEYNNLEEVPTKRTIAGRRLEGYEMNFYYLDFINSALVLFFQSEDRTWVIYHQGMDQLKLNNEPVSSEEVFLAITYSFLSSFDEK